MPEPTAHVSRRRLPPAQLEAGYEDVAKLGSVTTYRKKGREYYRIRLMVGGKTREIYSDLGRPFRDLAHAEWVLAQIQGLLRGKKGLDAIAQYLPAHSKPNLVSEKLDEYAQDLGKRHERKLISRYTVESWTAGKRYLEYWRGISLAELKKKHLEKYKEHLEDAGQAPSSVKLRLDQFRAFLGWCVSEEILTTIPPMPEVRVVKKRPKLYTPWEQRRVLEEIPWNRRGIFLALCLGMRPDSARAVRMEDVDRGFLHVHRGTQTRNPSDESADHTKGWKESWLPMSKDLAAWIEEHCRDRLPGALLFWNPTGRAKSKAWGHGSLAKEWKRACAVAGLPYVPLYKGTKHSFATGRLMAGKSKDALGEFMQISRKQVETYAQWSRELSAEVLDAEDLAPEAAAKILELRGRK